MPGLSIRKPGEQLLVVPDLGHGIRFQREQLLQALEMDRGPLHQEVTIVRQDSSIVMDGEGNRFRVAVGVRHEQQVVAVVDVRGVAFHVRGEKEDLAVHAALVRQARGDLRDQDEAVLLVLFLAEKTKQLPQVLVLLEGSQVVTGVGGAAPGKHRQECGQRRHAGSPPAEMYAAALQRRDCSRNVRGWQGRAVLIRSPDRTGR